MLPVTNPVSVTAPSSSVPVEDIVFVPPPLNRISAPLPVRVIPVVPLKLMFPETFVLSASVISPDPESILIFPVVFPPIVNVWLFVVWMLALLLSRAIDPERVATWFPLAALTLRIANFAEVVDVPPIPKSTVWLPAYNSPLF